METGREVLTDSTGFYHLTGMAAGTATIQVTYLNFDEVSAQVSVPAGEGITRDFALTNKTLRVQYRRCERSENFLT